MNLHPRPQGPNTVSGPDRSLLRPRTAVPATERLESRQLLSAAAPASTTTVPRPDHVVVVVEEDRSYNQILGAPLIPPVLWPWVLPTPLAYTPYLRGLAANSASFTDSHALGHPNATNYQGLFSGLNLASRAEANRPLPYTAPNLASELIAAGLTFGGYSESLPHTGYTGRSTGDYDRGHNAWVDYANVPAADNLPFSQFPADLNKLPTVSFVVPNVLHSGHSAAAAGADRWLELNLKRYVRWASTHNSMLIVTWDESSGSKSSTQIPTIFNGPMIRAGHYGEHITHSNVLRTIEDMYGLDPVGATANVQSITDVFRSNVGARKGARAVKARRVSPVRRQAHPAQHHSPKPTAHRSHQAGGRQVFSEHRIG